MALFGEADNRTPEDQEETPKVETRKPSYIEPEFFKGITIDTDYVPRSSMLQWLEGSLYVTDYYSQFLGKHSEPMPLSIDRSPTYQQYREIKSMELKVTSPISFSPDPTTRVMEVRGAGITLPFLVPNVGDMFVADVGDGRVGLFTVIEATRATILKDSVYNIEFVMQDEFTQQYRDDLQRKTIESFHFSRESLISGCGPFVTEKEYVRAIDYKKLREELVSRYLSDFYSRQYTTLLVPGQQLTTYDHFVVKVVRESLSTTDNPLMRRVRELPVGGERIMQTPTLWDAVVRHEPHRLIDAIKNIHLVRTNLFGGRPVMQTISYTGIQRIVFPVMNPDDVDSHHTHRAYRHLVGVELAEGKPRGYRPEITPPQETRNLPWFKPHNEVSDTPAERLPALYPVVKDDYYVLSQSFYEPETGVRSCLEILTQQVIDAKPISHPHLEQVLRDIWEWDDVERFYYYPLVWLILKYGAR